MRIVAIISAILVFLAVQVHAEKKHELNEGDRLRIRMMGSSDTYVLERIRPDTLFVFPQNGDGSRHIAIGQVERVDVRVPRSAGSGALRGALIGGAVGVVAGAVYGIATWDDVNVNCGELNDLCSSTASAFRFMGVITLFGAHTMLLGGFIGAVAPGERWQRVELPGRVSMRIDAGRTVSIQYGLAF
jgi:hypothetical protein